MRRTRICGSSGLALQDLRTRQQLFAHRENKESHVSEGQRHTHQLLLQKQNYLRTTAQYSQGVQ